MKKTLQVITTSVAYVYTLRGVLSRALATSFCALVILMVLPLIFSLSEAAAWFLSLFAYLIHTVIAVTTHRIILLGPESVPKWGLNKLTKREFKFILYGIGIGICLILPGLFALIPAGGWILALLGMCYLLGRLSLVFPAVATDKNWSFQDSWVATKPHQLMMITIVVIFPLVVAIPESLLSNHPYTEFISQILSAITTVLIVAALSIAFNSFQSNRN